MSRCDYSNSDKGGSSEEDDELDRIPTTLGCHRYQRWPFRGRVKWPFRGSEQGEKGEKGEKERGEKGEKGESTKWHLLLLSPPPLLELPLGSVEEEKGGGGTIVSHTPVDPKGVGGVLGVDVVEVVGIVGVV